MNGNVTDNNYRYTIDKPNVTICGKGNGIYTMFNNIDKICKSINHPKDILMGYIASVTCSNYNALRDTITGEHNTDDLILIILEYIKYLVMCPKCNIPETIPKIQGTKKNATIILCCSACKNESPVKNVNKRIDKGIDIIYKYLNKKDNTWIISKGLMVQQSDTNINLVDFSNSSTINSLDVINPFDSF